MENYEEIVAIPKAIHCLKIGPSEDDCTQIIPKLRSCSQVFMDVTLSDTNNTVDDALVFQNYYTSSLIVLQLSLSSSKYVTVLEKKLMHSAYSEEGSQNWFIIPFSEFNSSFTRGRSIRIVMIQPGDMYKTYEIRNLKVMRKIKAITKDSEQSNKGYFSEIIKKDHTILINALKDQYLLKDDQLISSEYRKANNINLAKRKDKKRIL